MEMAKICRQTVIKCNKYESNNEKNLDHSQKINFVSKKSLIGQKKQGFSNPDSKNGPYIFKCFIYYA